MEKTLTRDQKRARYAWEKAEEAGRRGSIDAYTKQAKSVAALIMNSGLMQTLAFLQAKNGEEHEMLKIHLCRWLGRVLEGTVLVDGSSFPVEQRADFERVMNALYKADSDLYMRATGETMALLRWVRQLADARNSMGDSS